MHRSCSCVRRTPATRREPSERTPGDEGGIYVLPVTARLSPDKDLACDWRGGDPW